MSGREKERERLTTKYVMRTVFRQAIFIVKSYLLVTRGYCGVVMLMLLLFCVCNSVFCVF